MLFHQICSTKIDFDMDNVKKKKIQMYTEYDDILLHVL